MPYPEFWFWLKLLISSFLTALLAWYSFSKENDNRHRLNIFIIAIIAILLSFWNSCDEHNEKKKANVKATKDSAMAEKYRIRSEGLAATNLGTAYDIKDSLLNASIRVTKTLNTAGEVLSVQKDASQKLSKQAKKSLEIADSIEASGRRIKRTVDSTTASIDRNLTGGDSYVILNPSKGFNSEPSLRVQNLSKNMIPNVTLLITNYTAIAQCETRMINDTLRVTQHCYWSNTKESSTLTVPSQAIIYLNGFSSLIDTTLVTQKIVIRIVTPQNTFLQLIKYSYINKGDALFGYALFKITDNGLKFIRSSGRKKNSVTSEAYWRSEFPLGPEILTY